MAELVNNFAIEQLLGFGVRVPEELRRGLDEWVE
jgi:hypothetical protein